jgi:uncharacterized protein (TIGR01777 family)
LEPSRFSGKFFSSHRKGSKEQSNIFTIRHRRRERLKRWKSLEKLAACIHNIGTPKLTPGERLQPWRDIMRIIISGSTGLIGSELVSLLQKEGTQITRLTRSRRGSSIPEIVWNPESGALDASGLEGQDAVVHLAGENIAEGRWTPAKKARIRDSRVRGTGLLAEALARTVRPPKVLVSASAIGYYGDRGEEMLNEESAPGTGFLPEVCQKWEAATKPASDHGIRVVMLRIGVVLSTKGGALAKMLLPFKMGVGGVVGSGLQYMSWIATDDLARIFPHVIATENLRGPVNAVSPSPVTNREFTQALGKALSRPTLFPLPSFAARLAFGEMADALLLTGARVHPAKLTASGYEFLYPTVDKALRHILG